MEAVSPDRIASPRRPGLRVLRGGVSAESERSDEEIVRALREGERWAAAALLDRYGTMVERLIRRVMGHDPDLEDLVQDAFARVLSAIGQVREGEAVKGWIASIAVHTAHHAIRKRRMARWFLFWRADSESSCEPAIGPRDALRRVYEVLDGLPASERVCFALRFFEEMPLSDVASACGVSLATVKRRLARAERRFTAAAQRDPVLQVWMEEGDRWNG